MKKAFASSFLVRMTGRIALLCGGPMWVGGAVAQAPVVPPTLPPAEVAAQVSQLGEEQATYLQQLLQSLLASERSAPLEVARERIARAVRTHPDVLALRATQGAASESTREIAAGLRPQITGQGDIGLRQADESTIFQTPERRWETASAAINLRQLLFDFGATQRAVAAGRERETASEARVRNRMSDMGLRAVQTWIDVVRARQQGELAGMNVKARESIVSFLAERQNLGGGSVGDVLRARSRFVDALAYQSATKVRVRTTEAAYREIFREDAPEELGMLDTPFIERGSARPVLMQWIQSLPAVQSATAAVRAAEQEREAAVLRTRPNIGLDLSATRRDLVGRGTPGNEFGASVNLRYTFYSGGAESARIGQAEQRLTEAREQVRSIVLQLERTVLQAASETDNADAISDVRKDGVRVAADALRAVREQFAYRRGTLLDLLNAQEVLQAAGQTLIDAEADRHAAQWRLLYFKDGLDSLLNIPVEPIAPVASDLGSPKAR